MYYVPSTAELLTGGHFYRRQAVITWASKERVLYPKITDIAFQSESSTGLLFVCQSAQDYGSWRYNNRNTTQNKVFNTLFLKGSAHDEKNPKQIHSNENIFL